jgi:ATP-binding protein involved in chromosome partitioning
MNKEEILNLLKQISYPGFSRDIVSFGMVNDILVEEDSVQITLKIKSANEDKKEEVVSQIKSVLNEKSPFDNISILFDKSSDSGNATEQPQTAQGPSTLTGIKHIIAVSSGKGGVGKSTVAANIALSIRNMGLKVGLLDLDIYGPSLPMILGLDEQPELNKDRKLIPLDHLQMKVMSFGFISGNQSPTIWRGPLVARMTEQFFYDVVWGELDYLILDLPPGTGDIQLTLTQKLKMDGALIVTTPQDIALADVKKGADMFRKVKTPVLGVIENMSGLFLEGRLNEGSDLTIEGQKVTLRDDGSFTIRMDLFKNGGGKTESDRLGVPLLGQIPISQDIMETTDSGKPIVELHPNSHPSKLYKEIAENVIDQVDV